MSKLVNLLYQHSGKWFEVGVFHKENDKTEEIDVIAKFKSAYDAELFARQISENPHCPYSLVVVR